MRIWGGQAAYQISAGLFWNTHWRKITVPDESTGFHEFTRRSRVTINNWVSGLNEYNRSHNDLLPPEFLSIHLQGSSLHQRQLSI